MTKAEYDNKIAEISGELEDIIDDVETIKDQCRKVLSKLEYLPELTELEEE